jgi:hypothetical protein
MQLRLLAGLAPRKFYARVMREVDAEPKRWLKL